MSPEVLMYVQKIKKYITTNDKAKDYFLKNDENDLFFDFVGDMSQKKFEESGAPELTNNDFEEIKNKISKPDDAKILVGIFYYVGDSGYVSLN